MMYFNDSDDCSSCPEMNQSVNQSIIIIIIIIIGTQVDAEVAASRKDAKYADIDDRYVFAPIAVK